MPENAWLHMPHHAPEPRWPPPHGGDAWWDIRDDAIGTADFRSTYFWDVRIRLQVRIEDGVIIDALCLTEDSEDIGPEPKGEDRMSAAITGFLKGKTFAEALTFADPIMWCPSMAVDAVKMALRNWAMKGGGPRFEQLPPLPPEPEPYRFPLWQRVLRRFAFFRGLGL